MSLTAELSWSLFVKVCQSSVTLRTLALTRNTLQQGSGFYVVAENSSSTAKVTKVQPQSECPVKRAKVLVLLFQPSTLLLNCGHFGRRPSWKVVSSISKVRPLVRSVMMGGHQMQELINNMTDFLFLIFFFFFWSSNLWTYLK